MAVIENRATADGDVLIIRTDEPIVGLIALTQFTDSLTGEVPGTDYYRKEFRVSLDAGTTFNAWRELTNANLQSTTINRFDQVVIEYRYTRVGNPPPLNLEFNNILVNATAGANVDYFIYDQTVFKEFFEVNDIAVFGWAVNVLEKIYQRGLILPDYVVRKENDNENLEDQDFLTFWGSITHYFALLVYYARQYQNITTNRRLLEEFLTNKDLTLPQTDNLTEILHLYSNYVDEYRKRGTLQIIERKSNDVPVDGELLRLIGNITTDEFLFAILKPEVTGWCLGKSSPTWFGTEFSSNVVKAYDKEFGISALNIYPLINDQYITLSNSEMVIQGVPANTESGIGGTENKITVDSGHAYEISFRIKQSVKTQNISFRLKCFDGSDNEIQPIDITDGSNTNSFFENEQLNIADKVYWVRGVVFPSSEANKQSETSLGGNNLRFRPECVSIVPQILVTNGASAGAEVTTIVDVKVRPLKFNFSVGNLGVRPIIYMLAKNRNSELNNDSISREISEKLIPYKFVLKPNYL